MSAADPGRPFRAPTSLLVSLYCAAASYGTLQSIVVPVLPEITRQLGATPAEAGWVLTSFLLIGGAATPVIGRLGDVYGNLRALVATLAVFIIGTVVALFAPSMTVLIIGRLLQGFGGATISLGYALVRNAYPPAQALGAIGRLAGATAASAAIGLSLAGIVTLYFDFRAIFVLPLVTAVLALVLILPRLKVPEAAPRSRRLRVNWTGAALFFIGVGVLLLAITQGGTVGWLHPHTIIAAAASVIALTGWAWSERRAAEPLLDVGLLVAPRTRVINLSTLFAGAFAVGGFALLPIALQTDAPPGLGLSPAIVGLIALPISCMNFVTSSITGRLAARIGIGRVLVLGFALSGLALCFLGLVHGEPWSYVVTSAIHGLGIGFFFSALPALTMMTAHRDQAGSAAGVFSTIRSIGSAVGTQLVFALLAGAASPGDGVVAGYWGVMGCWVVALVAAVAVAWNARREASGL